MLQLLWDKSIDIETGNANVKVVVDYANKLAIVTGHYCLHFAFDNQLAKLCIIRPCQINLLLLGRPRWKGRAGRWAK